jgi:hypothetical protein
MTLASYIIGHSGYVMLDQGIEKGNTFLIWLARSILVAFPNLEAVNLKNSVAISAPIDLSHWYMGYISVIIYTIVIVILSGSIFEKKTFDTV